MKRTVLMVALALVLPVLTSCGVRTKRTSVWVPPPRAALADSYSQFLIGRFASLSNDPQKAAESYAAALTLGGNDTSLIERAVFSLLLSGDISGAATLAAKAPPEALTEASLARLTLAIEDVRRGRTGVAAERLSERNFGSFNQLIAGGVHAWVALETSGLEAATVRLGDVTGNDPLIAGLQRAAMGLLQLSAKSDAAALASFEHMRDLGVRLAVATAYHAQLLALRGDLEAAQTLLADFRTAVGPNAAIDGLRRQLDAGTVPPLARPDYREGAALAVYVPAAALAAQASSDVAGVYFALALALDPKLDAARTLWGDALDRAGRRTEALRVLEGVAEGSVFYPTARGQIAWALRREGEDEAALDVARAALAAQPDRDLKVQLGDLFRSLEAHDDAEQIFSEVIETDGPDAADWRIFFARAAERAVLERWSEAEADLLQALDLAPNRPEVLNYLGYSWVDRGENLDEAFAMIQRAVDLRPNSGFIVDSLGWAYYRLGQYDLAVRHLERAVELEPGDPILNDHLGDAYWQVGRRLEAGFQWRRALSLNPDNANALILEAKLENGLAARLDAVTVEAVETLRP